MPSILENRREGEGVFKLKIKLDESMEAPRPGQFYMIQVGRIAPMLPRPFIAITYDKSDHAVSFLIQVRGKGTEILSQKRRGDEILLFGPLGVPFPEETPDKLCLIGGGIGIAALTYITESIKKKNPDCRIRAYLGYTGKAYGLELFKKFTDKLLVMEDGGYITDIVDIEDGETVITCGPGPMMQKVCTLAPAGNDVYLSLEARMACGVGACLGCVTEAPLLFRDEGEHIIPSGTARVQVCTNGPYFKREVVC